MLMESVRAPTNDQKSCLRAKLGVGVLQR